MKMKRIAALFAVLCLAMTPVLAKADTLTFNNAPTGEIGPYNLTLDGTQSLQLFCMNDTRTVSNGETWKVDVVNGSSYLGSRKGSTGFEYEEEAYIYSQFSGSNASTVQHALWQIFDPTNHDNKNSASNALVSAAYQFALGLVGDSGTNSILSDTTFYIYTGNSRNPPQNFVGTSPSPVPEPSSLMLFGSGLLGLAETVRRKMRRA